MNLVSESLFRLLLSAVTGGVAALWILHDVVLLARLRGARRRDPIELRSREDQDDGRERDALVADQRFGYAMGVVIGVLGVIGTLRFNGVL
jgi:hypothetical protein